MRRTYDLTSWSSPTDFLEQYGRRIGKLLKGGEPDTNAAAKLVLHDWQRGRLPYFTLPPDFAPRSGENAAGEGGGDTGGGHGGPLVAPKQPGISGIVTAHKFLPEDEGEPDAEEGGGAGSDGDKSDGDVSGDVSDGNEDVSEGDVSGDESGADPVAGAAPAHAGASARAPASDAAPPPSRRRPRPQEGSGQASHPASKATASKAPAGQAPGQASASQAPGGRKQAPIVSWDDVFGD